MKIAMLAARHDIHTVRWANGLSERGIEVHLLTQHPSGDPLHRDVRVLEMPCSLKLGYFANSAIVRRYLKGIGCDLLHAHYASGYGTLARLSGFHPLVLSVWGADVYDFPRQSWLHRALLARNLRAAERVVSISHCMARQTCRISPATQIPAVIPFGVNTNEFRPLRAELNPGVVTIGTVKKLTPKYGIDVLLRAFAHCTTLLPSAAPKVRLRVVGEGPQRTELETLSSELGIRESVQFVGRVPHREVCRELNQFDVYCAFSRLDSESFGVAIIEASACSLPVIVSDVGGLPEVVRNEETGLVVKREDWHESGRAMARLVMNQTLRNDMGRAGRCFVKAEYEWDECLTQTVDLYEQVLTKNGRKHLPKRQIQRNEAA